jgi:hypothetical protein
MGGPISAWAPRARRHRCGRELCGEPEAPSSADGDSCGDDRVFSGFSAPATRRSALEARSTPREELLGVALVRPCHRARGHGDAQTVRRRSAPCLSSSVGGGGRVYSWNMPRPKGSSGIEAIGTRGQRVSTGPPPAAQATTARARRATRAAALRWQPDARLATTVVLAGRRRRAPPERWNSTGGLGARRPGGVGGDGRTGRHPCGPQRKAGRPGSRVRGTSVSGSGKSRGTTPGGRTAPRFTT